MKFLCYLSIITALTVSGLSHAQRPTDKDLVLSKIKSGSINFKTEKLFWFLEGMSNEKISTFASKQKLANPKFNEKYLYKRYTEDQNFRHEFGVDYMSNRCLYVVISKKDAKNMKTCREKMFQCAYKDQKGLSGEKVSGCVAEIKECQESTRDKVKFDTHTIDMEYCNKIYGIK